MSCEHKNKEVNLLDLFECQDCGLMYNPFKGVWESEDAILGHEDICKVCGASPMTANCNNARCDD